MIVWTLVGIFATACAMLALFIWREIVTTNEMQAAYQADIASLKAERDRMLATALEANGKILIDPQAPPRQVVKAPLPLARHIGAKMRELAEADSKKALDRDARVAAEIDEANRIARGGATA